MQDAFRNHLLRIYLAALAAVNGRRCVADCLRTNPLSGPSALVATGKAAVPMAAGAYEVLGTHIRQGLVVTKYGHGDSSLPSAANLRYLESSHPLPDAASVEAGRELLDFLQALPAGEPLLVLISGGSSALVEVPAPGVTLADIQRANAWLLGSGLDIHAMNQVRKSLSAIKGGRLAAHVQGRPVRVLSISDVAGDDLRAIGSGMLTWHESGPQPPANFKLPGGRVTLPPWLQALSARALPLPPAEYFHTITQQLVATRHVAMNAAAAEARALGYAVQVHDVFLAGDALDSGPHLAQYLTADDTLAGIHIWSGEPVVRLPAATGRGGRCQSLALAAALAAADTSGWYLLAGGTDGSDGPGTDAGALVDGGTVARGVGRDARQDLHHADAGSFLAAGGDLIKTGPTGTNVMDLYLGLKT